MIEFPRDTQNSIPTSLVKIVGIGGAGANMLDRVALDGLDGAEMLALNSDVRTLSGSVAGERIQLGRNLTKGLGTGGDPELGLQAVSEAEGEIRSALKARRIVFICVGLGGGTGSGAAPIVARIAREEGAFVVMFATMPFAFEGRRRREQAETSLNELAVLSNALVTFDNGRMGELVLAKQGIHEAFAAADQMISESIKAVIRLVVRPGLINIGLDDLMSALRTTRSRCLFGSGIAKGKDRAQKALRNALSSPLLDQGALLKDAETVLVHLCGGEDLTLFEIELLMENLGKYVPEKAHVLFGAAVDPGMKEELSITLVSSLPEERLHQASIPRTPNSEVPVLQPTVGFASDTGEPVTASASETPKPKDNPEKPQTPAADVIPEPLPEKTPLPEVETTRPEVKPTPAPEPVIPPSDPEPMPAPQQEEAKTVLPETPPIEFVGAPKAAKKLEMLEPSTDSGSDPQSPFSEALDDSDREADYAFQPAGKELPQAKNPMADKSSTNADPDDDEPFKSGLDELFEGEEISEANKKSASDSKAGQPELGLDGAPRGRFEGENPSMFEGEDLDVPAFLRKKRT